MKNILLIILTFSSFSFGGLNPADSPTCSCSGYWVNEGSYNSIGNWTTNANLSYNNGSACGNGYYVATDKRVIVQSECNSVDPQTGQCLSTAYKYQAILEQYRCVTSPPPTCTAPMEWDYKAEQCANPPPIICDENQTLNTETNLCEDNPLPCDNPQLIRDSNGTCNCPDGAESFDEQYNTCLADGACPSEPTTTIYTDGICYRWFYDCVGFDKATETNGLTADECKNPIDPENDADSDGIPDALDDDMDGDGIPNNSDPDIDGDGVPNSSDSDSGRGPETNSTAPSEDMCRLRDPNSYRNGNTCACNPTYTMVEGVCKKPITEKDPCNYPNINSNYDFQSLTLSRGGCVDQYTNWSNNGRGIAAKLEKCDKYGCYYNTGATTGDENVSDTSVGTGEDLNNDGFPDMADGNGSTGDENELNKEDASALGELLGDALSNISVSDALIVNNQGIPPPSTVNIMGEQYTLFDANKIPPSVWETMQTLFKFMAIITGVITVFTTI